MKLVSKISIHAPVKGATNGRYKDDERRTFISIHAPVKGATLAILRDLSALCISIHAPVKGATQERSGALAANGDFNPRTREGCDQ